MGLWKFILSKISPSKNVNSLNFVSSSQNNNENDWRIISFVRDSSVPPASKTFVPHFEYLCWSRTMCHSFRFFHLRFFEIFSHNLPASLKTASSPWRIPNKRYVYCIFTHSTTIATYLRPYDTTRRTTSHICTNTITYFNTKFVFGCTIRNTVYGTVQCK